MMKFLNLLGDSSLPRRFHFHFCCCCCKKGPVTLAMVLVIQRLVVRAGCHELLVNVSMSALNTDEELRRDTCALDSKVSITPFMRA
jgi:hypothetical protein